MRAQDKKLLTLLEAAHHLGITTELLFPIHQTKLRQSLAKCSESGTISVATRELGFIEFYLCAFEINCANSAISSSEENGTCARITLPSPESFAAK